MLETVLGFLYGYDIEVKKMRDFEKFLDVVNFLGIERLRDIS